MATENELTRYFSTRLEPSFRKDFFQTLIFSEKILGPLNLFPIPLRPRNSTFLSRPLIFKSERFRTPYFQTKKIANIDSHQLMNSGIPGIPFRHAHRKLHFASQFSDFSEYINLEILKPLNGTGGNFHTPYNTSFKYFGPLECE